ncbi:ABC transporter substrate-binding protein [Nocardiopsis ansamitocini]|uniref:Siderophore-binding lipoprotein YfiY n=1 Tax=Nocardiopsis ansamitocini TaxID=1670832 RepID=A0A9W6UFS9_9ACTN|nr:ABC transporter substrate-binding protein [Nocardiopsis ansamitocini]GLU45766.1 putative siderophore-binding lipoprotein YfiY [Nocardiopsis ansamitocini]
MTTSPLTAAAALLVAVLALSGCADPGPPSAGSDSDNATRVVRAANGEVEIPAAPERIAVLWRPTLAAVTQLGFAPVASMGDPGAEDGGLSPYLPEGHSPAPLLVATGPGEAEINVEELAGAAPDLIIGVSTQTGDQAAQLPRLSEIAPTVLLDWEGTGSWVAHLTEVAEVLDASAAAEEAQAAYETAVAEVRSEIGAPSGTEVSLIRLQSEAEVRFETPRSFAGQVIDDLGLSRPEGQRTPTGSADYNSASYENLAEGDADMVFVFAAGGYADQAPRAFDTGVWAQLRAVREKQIFLMDASTWGAPGYPAAHRILSDVRAAFNGELSPAV